MSIVHKLHVRCDAINLILFVINSSGCIFCIVDYILIFSTLCLYYVLCLTLSFWFPPDFLRNYFCSNNFLTMHSMSVLGK